MKVHLIINNFLILNLAFLYIKFYIIGKKTRININIFLNEIANKLTIKETLFQQIQEKYKDLIIQTIHMKKIFFNHMNLKIANYNLNSKINGGVVKMPANNNSPNPQINFPSPGDFQVLKNIIHEEQLKSNNLLTELNLSKAKYDSLICDM